MKEVLTKDKSITFHSEKFDETYHSISGAKEEAIKKFVRPSNIKEKAKEGKITILDFCFGLGYNSAAAIDLIKETNSDCKINLIAIEIDKEILSKIDNLDADFENYNIIKELAKNKKYSGDTITATLIVDNASNIIKTLKQEFDTILFDPFSPKKCPELWTEEIFKNCYRILNKNGVLTTYSCATQIRANMHKAGFTVKDGPSIGRRAPSTIATKDKPNK